MKTIHHGNVYSFILTEDEWYSATEQQQMAWINQIMREGKDRNARYLNISVKPDEVMSTSPVARQHKVWGHTFDAAVEENFRDALLGLAETYHNNLTPLRMMAIARSVFG